MKEMRGDPRGEFKVPSLADGRFESIFGERVDGGSRDF